MVSTKKPNWFLAKGGMSKYLIPHIIMSGHNLNFNKHPQIPLVSYVKVAKKNDPTNTNARITINAIYLKTLDKKEGRHKYIQLYPGQVIIGYNVKGVNVTDLVVKSVEAMIVEQVIKTLKIEGKTQFTIHTNV